MNFNGKEYISIYEFKEKIGRESNALKNETHISRFKKYLSNLPIGMIEKITLDKCQEITLGYPRGKEAYSVNSINKFLEDNIRKSDVLNLLGGNSFRMRHLTVQYSIPIYILGKTHELMFYPKHLIDKALCPYDKDKYMDIYELAEKWFNKSFKNKKFIFQLKTSINKLPNGIISKFKLKNKHYFGDSIKRIEEVYSREDIEKFFCDYVLKEKAYKEIKNSASIGTIRKNFNKLTPKTIILGGNSDVFILRSDFEKLKIFSQTLAKNDDNKSYKEDAEVIAQILGCYTFNKAKDILKLTDTNFKKLIKEKGLIHSGAVYGISLFEKAYIDKLFEEQQQLLCKCRSKYYIISEIKEKYGCIFAKHINGSQNDLRRPVTKLDFPIILRGNLNYHSRKLFIKSEIDSLWDDYKLFNDLNSVILDDPFNDFIYKVENVLKIEYGESHFNTKNLWYQYIKKLLYETKMTDKARITFTVNQLAKNTVIIFSAFKREIYSYTAKEINNLYLNDSNKIKRSYQRDFYIFLKQMLMTLQTEGLPIPFKSSDLNDPKKYANIKEADKGIYSIEEYHALYEYVNLIEKHKKKAIADVKLYLKTMNKSKYKHYDSCWLYVLVQLTNNWRHGTVISQIPRIDLSQTQICSLNWLEDNNPSLEDANNIVFQIGRYITKINKTNVNAEGIFTVGEPLKIAFATAISICELRTSTIVDNCQTLIELTGNLVPSYNPHKDFFKDFLPGFKFENRKMNRTLTTLIWSVLRHLGKGLKESQVSRSHLIDQTTIDHYIKLSDKQVEHLVLDLFERNQFGFVTQSLTNILFGKETDKNIETAKMKSLNNSFGNVVKIEATAGFINRLAVEKEKVREYLKGFNLDELKILYYKALSGLLPSKERYYQCIYSECKYRDELGEIPRCDNCESSIINAYALSNIMDNYMFMMKKILEEFEDAPEGEKQKLANHFYILFCTVEQARNKFGRAVVDGFVEGKTENIKMIGAQLESKNLKHYTTTGVMKMVDFDA